MSGEGELFEALGKIESDEERRAWLREHAELAGPEGIERLVAEARRLLRVDAARALRLAEGALAAAEAGGQDESRALALRAQANALWFLNRNQAAIEAYDAALALFEAAGNQVEIGRTLSSSIQPLIRTGQYGRALEGVERARRIFTASGDGLRLARLDLNYANILHRQDRYEDALAVYEAAYRRLLPYKDEEGIAAVLHNMAVCLIPLNDFAKALETYRVARVFFEEHGMPALTAQADYNIAYLYYLRGSYSRALAMLQEALEACRRTGDAYHQALCRMDQSEIYLELQMGEEAAEAAGEALEQFQALGIDYEAAKCVANLGIAHGLQGQAELALEQLERARGMFVRENNPMWPSLIDLYRAVVWYEAERLEQALPLCRDALAFFEAQRIPGKEILCRLWLARLELAAGKPAEALEQLEGALEQMENLEAPHLRYEAHFLMGQAAEAAGQPDLAAGHYRAARSSLESMRGLLRGEEIKIAFLKTKLAVYEGLVRLSLEAGDGPAVIFEAMEAAKSRSLRDRMVEGNAGPAEASAAMRQILELREELNWCYHREAEEQLRREGPERERMERLQAEVVAREKRLMRLVRELPPAEAEAAGMPSSPALTAEAIQASLGPDTTLVEYFQAGEDFLAAVVTARRLELFPLGPAARLAGIVRLLHFQLSKCSAGPAYAAFGAELMLNATLAHLEELYGELVAPLLGRLNTPRLVIVPHGFLHQTPFHALFDGEAYLADRYAISYSPSASVYALCKSRAANAGGRPLVMGIPDERAPQIAEEIRTVAGAAAGAEVFLGEEASRDVLAERGPRASLIHIATHGRFRRDNPMFSSIRLGDAYLTLYDLERLRLPVDLVTLSGCSTGLHVVAAGDEPLGLVRGLLAAGAKSLLLSLWDVHDESTAQFMQAFYGRLAERADKALALQEAMKTVRKYHKHPYFWAPFFLTGSTGQ